MTHEPIGWIVVSSDINCNTEEVLFSTIEFAYEYAGELERDGFSDIDVVPLYAVPPDHIIVPREPTEAMIEAGVLAAHPRRVASPVWKAMIEAVGVDDE